MALNQDKSAQQKEQQTVENPDREQPAENTGESGGNPAQLVPQQGEIKNNDRDLGTDSRPVAGKAGSGTDQHSAPL